MVPKLVWQPVIGCSAASAGCRNCKSPTLAGPALREEIERDSLSKLSSDGKPTWLGKLAFSKQRLREPLERAGRALFFVNAHGDTFHESAMNVWIDLTFDIMERCPQHGFSIMTKRSRRMREYLNSRYVNRQCPLNITAGVSVENQERADESLPDLVSSRVTVRYASCYPLLGPIDLRPFLSRLAFVAAGQEPERPADPAWMTRLRDDCADVGVPFVESSRLLGA